MTIQLWDLAGAEDDRRFSPYCWRVKMALRHKDLAVRETPWRFTEKGAIAFSGQKFVPVILDRGRSVSDSWQIALYLDEAYPDRPRLFGAGEDARAFALFLKHWSERNVHTAILRAIILDLFDALHDKDKRYFRASRESRLGKTLEEFGADRAGALASLDSVLEPVRALLAEHPFLGGGAPRFADYILFGPFQWARAVSPVRLLEVGDPVFAWRERMLDLFGGYARSSKGYDQPAPARAAP